MASIASSCRCSARAISRQARSHGPARAFSVASKALAASNFKMPALSPTMTEGNIASWKLKEGDSFSAGDVILEVETDKATMDVEAQDDGILAKIMQGDGSKAVQVGTRIAVLAEAGDDISSLEIPEDEPSAPSKTGKSDAPAPTQAEPPPSQQKNPGEKPERAASERGGSKSADAARSESSGQPKKATKGQSQNKKYPLYPSVAVLIHQHNLSVEDLIATGPGGRLLKGDVLAAIGQAPTSYPADLSSRLNKRSHLDLSEIKRAPAKVEKETSKPTEKAAKAGPLPPISVTAPISMANVLKVQRRLQDALGVSLPLSTFVARAVEMANEDLPASKSATPTADELFDAVVGVHNVGGAKKSSRGHFMPQIIALPTASAMGSQTTLKPRAGKKDILDELLGSQRPSPANVGLGRRTGTANAISSANNIFSLSVDEREKKRAQIFLQRVKTVLEAQPGTLIL